MTGDGLGEGGTPLVRSVRIGNFLGLSSLYFKLESCNPSGSYKDRFIAAEIRLLRERGVRSCLATSSGNTGSALAAYCARFGIRCTIIVNEHAPAAKLAQMQAHGARVLRVRDFVTSASVTQEVYAELDRASRRYGAPLVVSAYRYCPQGMIGVESLGRELQDVPKLKHVFVPVGGGGLYSATVRGLDGTDVRVHAAQPDGCSTVVAAWQRGDDEIRTIASTTRISGLSVPSDIDASLALRLLRSNGGCGFAVTDDEVFEAQKQLLEYEGIYCEPAGAAALAAVAQARRRGVTADETTVCLVTGHGFKDPDSITAAAARHPSQLIGAERLAQTLEAVA
jgi:threonine synthase